MGILASRQLPGAEEADVVSNHAYKYPPRSGSYFGTHFIMGGERFDTPQPEAYLFGENTDLNFLGSRPTPNRLINLSIIYPQKSVIMAFSQFPYPPPQSNEPTKTLKSLVNIRKESVRFVRAEAAKLAVEGGDAASAKSAPYNIEFTFDCDVRCAITVYYFCTEEVTPTGAVYCPRDTQMNSQTFHYKKGANQQFCQTSHVFDPTKYSEEDLCYNAEKEIIPIAIHCVVEEGSEDQRQSHTTIGIVEKHSDGTYVLKALKQKLFVDGLCYLLQEIYGIENKNIDTKPGSDEETEDGGSECVICMSEVRDTLILPCRHLCLCNSCADSLRYQANNCPICRAPFRALLQIRALQRTTGAPTLLPSSPPDGSLENIPPGYEPVSLIEALNGPCLTRVSLAPPTPQPPHASPSIASPDADSASQAAEALNRCSLERSSSCGGGGGGGGGGKRHARGASPKDVEGKSPRDRALAQPSAPEFRMSVLLARDEENKNVGEKIAASSPLLFNHRTHKINGAEKIKKHLSEPEAEYAVEEMETDGEAPDGELEAEGDSEAERLSPLLTHKIANGIVKANGPTVARAPAPATMNGAAAPADKGSALHLEAPAMQHIDDTDTDEPELSAASATVVGAASAAGSPVLADDSDYFTPEDTNTTILTVPKNPNKHDIITNNITSHSSAESTPQRWALPLHVTSLPGTPLSHASARSSGDSYSSSSSTRQLLAPHPHPAPAALALAADTHC